MLWRILHPLNINLANIKAQFLLFDLGSQHITIDDTLTPLSLLFFFELLLSHSGMLNYLLSFLQLLNIVFTEHNNSWLKPLINIVASQWSWKNHHSWHSFRRESVYAEIVSFGELPKVELIDEGP